MKKNIFNSWSVLATVATLIVWMSEPVLEGALQQLVPLITYSLLILILVITGDKVEKRAFRLTIFALAMITPLIELVWAMVYQTGFSYMHFMYKEYWGSYVISVLLFPALAVKLGAIAWDSDQGEKTATE